MIKAPALSLLISNLSDLFWKTEWLVHSFLSIWLTTPYNLDIKSCELFNDTIRVMTFDAFRRGLDVTLMACLDYLGYMVTY